ncbi:MAG: nitrate reductase cytochrome c-type subunit [Planctomycetaceae bacterium]|nr:nitrate reductase cytochrome c-type subunit [Planctomycetaceae bacterium]
MSDRSHPDTHTRARQLCMALVLSVLLPGLLPGLVGCSRSEPEQQFVSKPAQERGERRAFHGAPPVIPHPPLTGTCVNCHTPEGGRQVVGIGVSPANPHTRTPGMSEQSRCRQCHVFRAADDEFVASDFVAATLTGTRGERAFPEAPPVIPHDRFMREDCDACHTGSAARQEIVCKHADRQRCTQCHVHQTVVPEFASR